MRLIKKYQYGQQFTAPSDNTNINLGIVPNLPIDNSILSKFLRDLAFISAVTDEEREAEDFHNRATNQGVYKHTVAPTNVVARNGHIWVDPKTGDVTGYTAPTTVSAAPLTEGLRMWQSPALLLALSIPTIDLPFIFKGLNPKILPGKTRLKVRPIRTSVTNPRIVDKQAGTVPAHYNVDDVTQQLIDYTRLHDNAYVDVDWIKDAANRIMTEGGSKFSNFDLDVFKRNYYPEIIDDFITDTYFHDAFNSADDIIREFAKMGRPEEDVFIDKNLIGQFYSKDVFPRTIANLKERGINLNPEEIKELSRIYESPWEGVNMKHGYTEPGTTGYSRGPSFVRFAFDEEVPYSTVGHELHHSVRRRLAEYLKNKGYKMSSPADISRSLFSTKYSRRYGQRVLPEYTSKELKNMRKYKLDLDDRGVLTPTNELGATLAELRLKYFKQYLDELKLKNKTFNLSEFDKWLSSTKQTLAFRDLSLTAYGTSFAKRFGEIGDKVIEHYYRTGTYPRWLPKAKVREIEALKKLDGYNYFYWRLALNNALAENLGKLILKDASKVAGYGVPIGLGGYLNQDESSLAQ